VVTPTQQDSLSPDLSENPEHAILAAISHKPEFPDLVRVSSSSQESPKADPLKVILCLVICL
jgi:hypothetical protein